MPVFVPPYSRISDLAKLLKTSTSKITSQLRLLKNKKKVYLRHEGVWFEFHSTGEVIVPSSAVESLAAAARRDVVCLNEQQLLSFAPPSGEIHQAVPVVALLGHFNHGKTTLLDALRGGASIVDEEVHHITQVG